MTPVVPRIAVFCNERVSKTFVTSNQSPWVADCFEVHYFNNTQDITVLNKLRISLVVSIGPLSCFKDLLHIQIPHYNFKSEEEIDGDLIYKLYSESTFADFNPTVSIFTPSYNSFERFDRAYESVIKQSFKDWEWIILDDSPDSKNYDYINSIIKNDSRIKLYKSNKQDGLVGSTKRQAASLCNGEYLLELDHDDELHFLALDFIVSAFKKYPDAGFCYSNCTELFEDGGHVIYGKGYAKGFGVHFDQYYQGRHLVGSDTPINASTIRHIVGVPNHLRCWRKDVYFDINRHNNKMAIVDDYELIVRTFLKTKFVQIPDVLYIQYMNSGGNNTQEPRRAEIQRMVHATQKYYDKAIHERIIELGGDDWLWVESQQQSFDFPPPNNRSNLAYVYKL